MYEVAPLADKVELLPAQIIDGDAVALIVGFGLTNKVIELLDVQKPFAPITV